MWHVFTIVRGNEYANFGAIIICPRTHFKPVCVGRVCKIPSEKKKLLNKLRYSRKSAHTAQQGRKPYTQSLVVYGLERYI